MQQKGLLVLIILSCATGTYPAALVNQWNTDSNNIM